VVLLDPEMYSATGSVSKRKTVYKKHMYRGFRRASALV